MIELPVGRHNQPPDIDSWRQTTSIDWPTVLDAAGVEVYFRPDPPAHRLVDGVWTAPKVRDGLYWFPGWVFELRDAFMDVIEPETSGVKELDELLMPAICALAIDPSLVEAMQAASRLGGAEAVYSWAAQFYPRGLPSPRYSVTCDDTNNTPEDVAAGKVNVRVGLKP